MILLTSASPPGSLTVGVFGTGLIGSAVVDALERIGLRGRRLPLCWSDSARQRRDLAMIEAVLRAGMTPEPRPQDPSRSDIVVVWSAGAAGFAAGDAETEDELDSFRAVLAMSCRLAENRSARVGFCLVSSAGGLFEGCRLVHPGAEPVPRRAYGRLKLAQEKALAESPELGKRIYRLSSVFGRVAAGRRLGLIPTLIADGLRQRVSTVTGRPDTLRDFIWAGDVGRFVARDVADRPPGAEVETVTLASGKATSLHEARCLIETALRRKLYLSYLPNETGEADITFARDVLPFGWRSGDLYTNVCRVRDGVLGRGRSQVSA